MKRIKMKWSWISLLSYCLLAVVKLSSSHNGVLSETRSHEDILSEENVESVLKDDKFTMAIPQKVKENKSDQGNNSDDDNQLADSQSHLLEACLKEAEKAVNRAFNHEKYRMKMRSPDAAELLYRSRWPSKHAIAIAHSAEIYMMSYDCLKKKVGYVSPTNMQRLCKRSECADQREKIECSNGDEKYRSIDGTCNNIANPTQGASLTPYSRVLRANYEDGIGVPVGWKTTVLPSAREISLDVISIPKEEVEFSTTLTHMVMQFGQFLDHDLGLTAENPTRTRLTDGEPCEMICENEEPCFPILVPKDDPRIRCRRCLPFRRSPPTCCTGKLTERQQLNELTSYIDASNVYGSEKEQAEELRELHPDRGLLKVGQRLPNGRFNLPFIEDSDMVTPCMTPEGAAERPRCFLAGDRRVNEQVGLITMHTIWMRQHNRIATELRRINPHWDGETIYQEARKIVGGQMQHIVYTEWLPKVIGLKGVQELGGSYGAYDPKVDASILNSFTTAAFRFGHTTIRPFLSRLDKNFKTIPQGNLSLHQAFFAPERVPTEGGIDPVLRGLFATAAQQEMGLNSELTERLFEMSQSIALDLASLNIQRGRDHGLPFYNHWRKFCDLSVASDFDGFSGEIKDEKIRQKLKELYKNVEHVDLFVGGVLEDIVKGSRVGPTFLCLIRTQFQRLRDGDRFYYENPGVFSAEQLQQIKKTTLANVICDNGDNIKHVPRDVFLKIPIRDYSHCSKLPKPDLSHWTEVRDYFTLESGTCSSKPTEKECESKVAAKFGQTFRGTFRNRARPYGCLLVTTNDFYKGVWFNADEGSTESCSSFRKCLCAAQPSLPSNAITYLALRTNKRNTLLRTIPKLSRAYTVKFDFNPSVFQGGWTNILHFTTGGNCCNYGYRIPGVWFHGSNSRATKNRLHICSAVNGRGNYCFNSGVTVRRGQWTTVMITQQPEGNHYRYTVRVGIVQIGSVINTQPREFSNVKVYASDNYYNAAQGSIRNLIIIPNTQQGQATKTPQVEGTPIDGAFSNIQVDRTRKPYSLKVSMAQYGRPTAYGQIDETNKLVQTGYVHFSDDRKYNFWYYTREAKIYWDNDKGRTRNIWTGVKAIKQTTFTCHRWTSEDLTKMGSWRSVATEKNHCENNLGFKFSQGDESKAPGCGTCWCCRPIKG